VRLSWVALTRCFPVLTAVVQRPGTHHARFVFKNVGQGWGSGFVRRVRTSFRNVEWRCRSFCRGYGQVPGCKRTGGVKPDGYSILAPVRAAQSLIAARCSRDCTIVSRINVGRYPHFGQGTAAAGSFTIVPRLRHGHGFLQIPRRFCTAVSLRTMFAALMTATPSAGFRARPHVPRRPATAGL
jgi:hypothetical protein